MSKPTTARSPQEQYKLERKRVEKRMKPKPVLADKIKRKEERELTKREKLQQEGKEKVYTEGLI